MSLRKIIIAVTISLFFIGGFLSVKVNLANAAITGELRGWAWSENIGWISFNCADPNICATSNYKVSANNGALSGYAWSENVGWISFNSADLVGCPSGVCAASISSAGAVSGWAKALIGSAPSGWDGWIKLDGSTNNLSLNTTTNDFSGWVWSDNTIGWISFNCSDLAVCAISNYKVYLASTAPTASLFANGVTTSLTIPYNTAANLTWSSTNATSCTGTNFSTGGATNNSTGISTGNLYATKTYSVSCTGPGGTTNSSVDVHVNPVYTTCSGSACVSNTGIEGQTYTNLCSSNCTSASYCGGSGGGGATGPNWHSVCANNACVVVNGAGTNQCSTALDCGAGSNPTQSYGACAQGYCVMVSGTPNTCEAAGVSSCSNYGGTCPNPPNSSFYLKSSNDLRINIIKKTGTVDSNSTILTIEPVLGFSDTVNLTIPAGAAGWGDLTAYNPQANFSRTSLTSSQYGSGTTPGATLSVTLPVTVPSGNYPITVCGNGVTSGSNCPTVTLILHNANDVTWQER